LPHTENRFAYRIRANPEAKPKMRCKHD